MIKFFNTFLSIGICCLIFSCAPFGSSENARLISEAQRLLYEYELPDSALTLLDAVNVTTLNKAKRADFLLLRIDARSLAGIDISKDDEIFPLYDWFVGRRDAEKAALVCLHTAQTLFMQGSATQATETYLEAFDFAQNTPNNRLKARIMGRLGDVYYDGGLFDEALAAYLQALDLSKNANDAKNQIETLIKIGNCYLLLQRYADAFDIYIQAENLAQSINHAELLISALHNRGVALMATGNHEQATEMFSAALAYPNMKDSAILFINLAGIHFDYSMFDEAFRYGQRAIAALDRNNDVLRLPSIYRLMTLIEMQRRNISGAIINMTTYDFFLHEIMERRKNEALLEVQQRYNFEKAQTQFAIKQRNHVIIILIALIVIFALVVWVCMSKIRSERTIAQLMLQLDDLRQAERQLRLTEQQLYQSESQLHEAEQQIETYIVDVHTADEKKTLDNEKNLNDLRSRYDEQTKTFMMQHFNVLTQIARECKNRETVEIERLKRLLFGSSDFDFWAASEKLIPKGLTEKIKKLCSELDPNELKICCLLYLNADATAISLALNIKEKSIYTYSSRIRTKLDMGSRTNIKKFLEEKLLEIYPQSV